MTAPPPGSFQPIPAAAVGALLFPMAVMLILANPPANDQHKSPRTPPPAAG